MPNQNLLRAVVCAVIVWAGLCCSSTALAEEMTLINLEWRPATQTVEVGDMVDIGLWAVVGPGEHQYFRALDMVFTWDTTYLDLLGLDATGAVDLLSSDFPYPDTLYNINEADPPQDGDGYYQAFAPLGPGVDVYDAGVLLTTFQFEALAESLGTLVDIPAYGGDPELETTVWGGGGANRDRTGTLGDATVIVRSCGTMDFDSDGDVDLWDFAAFQRCFTGEGGPVAPECACVFDADADNDVDLVDFAAFEAVFTGP